ncbi:MAG: hypothetical protein AAFU03_16805, partial [Bacteroidota bacterium]
NLMDTILSKGSLALAYSQVVSNQGSAGVDGMKCEELMEFMQGNWNRIRNELRNGSYIPQPVKEVEIPKPKGRKGDGVNISSVSPLRVGNV